MPTWFQAKIKFNQEDEKGGIKSTGQAYVFDAVSYTDAEARVYAHLSPEIPDFQLTGLVKMNLNEVFFEDNGAEIWYKCKAAFIVFDEKTQKEKQTPFHFLLNAPDIKTAYTILQSKLGVVQDYVITDISATKILDVIPYEEDDHQEIPSNLKPLSEIIDNEVEINH